MARGRAMQTSTVQTNLQNPCQAPFKSTEFLLEQAAKEYQRVTVEMYGQQMANVKTYLWTANLILTGTVFLLVQFKQCWSDPNVNIVVLGFGITVACCLIAIPIMFSCLLTSFRWPISGFRLWNNWHKELEEYFTDVSQTDSEFVRILLERYDESIEFNRKQLTNNGDRLYWSNTILTIGIGAACISLLIFIPYLVKGGI